MTNKRQRGHDEYTTSLWERLRAQYEFMARNVVYRDPHNGTCGEMDLIGKVGHRIDIYEIKCDDGFSKAHEQLFRARSVLEAPGLEIGLFHYAGRTDELRKVK